MNDALRNRQIREGVFVGKMVGTLLAIERERKAGRESGDFLQVLLADAINTAHQLEQLWNEPIVTGAEREP